MRIVCQQTILMKYHPLFFLKIKKDVAKFVICCSRDWCFKGKLDPMYPKLSLAGMLNYHSLLVFDSYVPVNIV